MAALARSPLSRAGCPQARGAPRVSTVAIRQGGFNGAARSQRTVARAADAGMAPELKSAIDELITKNKVVVFMKGTKQFPQCGFSNTVVQILREVDANFEAVNVLEADAIRSGMKEYSAWPTFPQVYIDGEFYGGCDIMIESFNSGELRETIERVMNE
ncbi:MAG: glutaredoxin subgroup II [Monoraphidium minutum]|nr:MAG: glutaredoxin subgroup II [Monoraphidium minutum]